VRDDVVQLAGDPLAFGRGGELGLPAEVTLGVGGPPLHLGDVGAAGPGAVAGQPRGGQHEHRHGQAGRLHRPDGAQALGVGNRHGQQ
jgi:hypothetical protein